MAMLTYQSIYLLWTKLEADEGRVLKQGMESDPRSSRETRQLQVWLTCLACVGEIKKLESEVERLQRKQE